MIKSNRQIKSKPREEYRKELDLKGVEIKGVDRFEVDHVAYLNGKGFPKSFALRFSYPANSPNYLETYELREFFDTYRTVMDSPTQLVKKIKASIEEAIGCKATVELVEHNCDYDILKSLPLDANHLTDKKIVHIGVPEKQLYKMNGNKMFIHFANFSHFVDENPVYAQIEVDLVSKIIPARDAILRYFIAHYSYKSCREKTIEKMYRDLFRFCNPQDLILEAFYAKELGISKSIARITKKSQRRHRRLYFQ